MDKVRPLGARWGGEGWEKRLLIWPRDGVVADGANAYNMAYLGRVGPELENIIHVCKAAKLLGSFYNPATRKYEDMPFDAAARVIGAINDATELTMIRSFPTIRRRAVTKQDCEDRCIRPYCEHPAISLHQFGIIYRAI